MRKYYCDSCELETHVPNTFEVPCHLYSLKGKPGYMDNDFNPVSGRMDQIDLCNGCRNLAYLAALKALDLPKSN